MPGLVLACLRPGKVLLIDAQARRVAFMREAAHELDIPVELVHARAEDVARGSLREGAHGVTARALAPLPVALELTAPLAGPGGVIVLPIGSEPAGAVEEPIAAGADSSERAQASWATPFRRFSEISRALGGDEVQVAQFEIPGLKERRWVMIVPKAGRTPDRFPRSIAAMRRRPLGGGVA